MRGVVGAVVAVAVLALTPAAVAQSGGPCTGTPDAAGVPERPGPPLNFGINPAGDAGVAGPTLPTAPEDPARTLDALRMLRPPQGLLTLRLNRFFWSDREEGFRRFRALVARYTSAGFPVELQVRYHPDEQQEGDIDGFLRFVRRVVDEFGPNRRVAALQVTNEVNLTVSPDSSDGAFEGAREALVRGVIAAKARAKARGFGQLKIGFNWFYRTDEGNEQSFWRELRDRGGPTFVRSVDWVGLDLYPGTFFPPAEAPGGERDAFVNALSVLRDCFLPIPGIPASVPIKIEENGYPTGPGRTYERQAEALETQVRAAHDFRGTFNVSDYRWFDLRDENSESPNFQQQYGLLRDDYEPKPAFGLYESLVSQLARAESRATSRARLRVGLRVSCGRRSVALRAAGTDAPALRRADFFAGGRRLARDDSGPFSVRVSRSALRRSGGSVSARYRALDGRSARATARACAAQAPRFTG